MIKCPRCDYKYDLVGDEQNQALVAVIKMVGSFGQYSGLMLEYALVRGAGKPIQGKELKLLQIMEDLEKLWTSEKFTFNRKTYSISKAAIAWCLKTVCDKNWLTKLQNDNYLKQIMVTVAEKEAMKRGAEQEKELIQKEKKQRNIGQRVEVRGEYTPEMKKLTQDLMQKLETKS